VSLSAVLFLFLAHLAIGIAFTLLLIPREAGVKFFRFNSGLATILLAVSLAFRPAGIIQSAPTSTSTASLAALTVAQGAILLYWGTVGRVRIPLRRWLVSLAVLAGSVAMTMQALTIAADRAAAMKVLTVASFLSSAAFLGGACTAMILGHWYLVIPSMQVTYLQSMVKFHIGSMIVRVVVVAAAVLLAIGMPTGHPWHSPQGFDFRHYIFSVAGIFFWQRVLFGLAGPAVLSYLTWETAKIRSTQSATGILYVDFFTVVVGEVLAKYLLLATRVPV